MDPRAYATLFPRERFETFVSAASFVPPPADVHDEEQQQATASQSRPIGRARHFAFGFAGLAQEQQTRIRGRRRLRVGALDASDEETEQKRVVVFV